MSPVPICILGAPGLIGVRHTAHVNNEPQATLTCIVDPTPTGPPFAEKHGVKLFKSLEEMLEAKNRGEVEVVGAILATPNATHVTLGIKCLEAGLHVLVEKPMSTDIPSGRELLAAESKATTKILVGQHRRWNAYVLNLKKMLDCGSLGKSKSRYPMMTFKCLWTALKPMDYFEGPTAWRKSPPAGGPILINLVHEIDCFIFLFGDVERVYCEGGISTRGHAVEETGALTLKFASGVVGTFIFSDAAASPYFMESGTGENPNFPQAHQNCYTIMGTHGSTAFPELRQFSYPSASGCWTDTFSPTEPAPVEDVPAFTRQLKNFVGVCKGTEKPNCTGEQALKTIITLEAIRESMITGKPVEVDNPK
ncbi:quinate utilization oxidoreductase QutH [Pseudohyphozyma bogoriensis]|nr:quinate utilization oxidoreductase QutH [Pseudohyphozyma bogoriensis]